MITHELPNHGALAPYGLLVHTTGDGLASKSLVEGDAVAATVEVYSNMKEGPHYAIVPSGELIKFREPDTVSWHAGVSAADREMYLNGSWEDNGRIPKAVIDWWKLRWPGKKSPQHLYPGKSPNSVYVGVELIPCGVYQKSAWTPILGTPATPKGRYTAEQYGRVALLAVALSKKFGWPDNFEGTARLLGHEDIDPKDRPGWDPGGYHGWFSWSLLKGLVKAAVLDGTGGNEC